MKSLLFPLQWVFYLIVKVRNGFYDKGIFSSKKVSPFVISVGNLAVGGAGKTPWVLEIVRRLKENHPGRGAGCGSIGVVALGYKGAHIKKSSRVLKVSVSTTAKICGDEPLMMAKKGVNPLYVSRSKLKSAQKMAADEDITHIIVDDGFQHRRLHRDLDIVIVDVSQRLDDLSLLPAGKLREPLSQIKRADLVILNKWNLASDSQKDSFRFQVEKYVKPSSLVGSSYEFQKPVPWDPLITQEWRASHGYLCMAALARPVTFFDSCEKFFGQKPAGLYKKGDHHHWSDEDLKSVVEMALSLGVKQVITTDKDVVKIQNWDSSRGVHLWVLPLSLSIEFGEENLNRCLHQLELQ